MNPALVDALKGLAEIQSKAAGWGEGSALVLAGPGSGKTRVLTCRIARLLEESGGKRFRVLALTFTTKAATEMRERLDVLAPNSKERSFIGTFHAFCTHLLRQHGSHLGWSPDFAIYDQVEDREALLSDALLRASESDDELSERDVKWLATIDQLKSRLVVPEKTETQIRDPAVARRVRRVYELYESVLRAKNALDFNGLVLEACRLLRDVPGIAQRVRSTYPYWLVDEFQDTSPAQYRLLTLAAGADFRNLFAVADDDQIIYQWAGASYRQIEKFRSEFKPILIQLVENHRCPEEIVAAANRLVAHNTFRTPEKQPLVAARRTKSQSISLSFFEAERDETEAVARRILEEGPKSWGHTAVLARLRTLLVPIHQALRAAGVKATILQRRDRFISPHFSWLQASLDQAQRPNDLGVFKTLVDAANRVASGQIEPDLVVSQAQAQGKTAFELWTQLALASANPAMASLGQMAAELAISRKYWRSFIRDAIPFLLAQARSGDGPWVSDAEDDRLAWDSCSRDIRSELGPDFELDDFLQGLALRSKEPPRDVDSVGLLTVHSSKGLEFDVVYVVGLAESILPSWQSIGKGDSSQEMEEERRNCFVAITRTRESLYLSAARTYQGRRRAPSRFLTEMGVYDGESPLSSP